jgi:hypothetical protein
MGQIGGALNPGSIAPIFKRVAQWIGMPERFPAAETAEWLACVQCGTPVWHPVNARGPSAGAYWRPHFATRTTRPLKLGGQHKADCVNRRGQIWTGRVV